MEKFLKFFALIFLFTYSLSKELLYPISRQEFLYLIKSHLNALLENMNKNETEVKYKLTTFYMSLPEKVYLPLDYKIEIKLKDKPSKTCQNFNLRIYIPLGNKTYKSFSGVFCYKTYVKAYKASRFIKKGEIITLSDISPTYVPSSQKNYVFENKKDIVGKEAKVNIRENQIIYKYYLTKPKLVKRGDTIHLIAYKNGIFVDIQVIALSPGGKGDFIYVKNPSSGKVLRCKLVSKNICLFEGF